MFAIDPAVLANPPSELWGTQIVTKDAKHTAKLVRFGPHAYGWDEHSDLHEFVLVIEGRFIVDFKDRQVSAGPGEFIAVPKGTAHRVGPVEPGLMLLVQLHP